MGREVTRSPRPIANTSIAAVTPLGGQCPGIAGIMRLTHADDRLKIEKKLLGAMQYATKMVLPEIGPQSGRTIKR